MAPRRRAKRPQNKGPTHIIKMKAASRDDGAWSKVGAAWEKDNGNFTLKLSRGVVLDWHDFEGSDPEFSLILVPAD